LDKIASGTLPQSALPTKKRKILWGLVLSNFSIFIRVKYQLYENNIRKMADKKISELPLLNSVSGSSMIITGCSRWYNNQSKPKSNRALRISMECTNRFS